MQNGVQTYAFFLGIRLLIYLQIINEAQGHKIVDLLLIGLIICKL